MAQGGQFGSGMGGFSQEVAEGLTTFVPPSHSADVYSWTRR